VQTDHAGELELSVGGPMGDSVAGGTAGIRIHMLCFAYITSDHTAKSKCKSKCISMSILYTCARVCFNLFLYGLYTYTHTITHTYIYNIYILIHISYTYPAKCEEQACTKKHGN
jgi:hypothetical protein